MILSFDVYLTCVLGSSYFRFGGGTNAGWARNHSNPEFDKLPGASEVKRGTIGKVDYGAGIGNRVGTWYMWGTFSRK